jgi:hypothetical protein
LIFADADGARGARKIEAGTPARVSFAKARRVILVTVSTGRE